MSQASMLIMKCAFALSRVRAGSCISTAPVVDKAVNVVSSNEGNPAGWSFCSCLFSVATILAKFETNRRNTFHNPRMEQSFIRDVKTWSMRMASVVCDANSRRLVRMTCPR